MEHSIGETAPHLTEHTEVHLGCAAFLPTDHHTLENILPEHLGKANQMVAKRKYAPDSPTIPAAPPPRPPHLLDLRAEFRAVQREYNESVYACDKELTPIGELHEASDEAKKRFEEVKEQLAMAERRFIRSTRLAAVERANGEKEGGRVEGRKKVKMATGARKAGKK